MHHHHLGVVQRPLHWSVLVRVDLGQCMERWCKELNKLQLVESSVVFNVFAHEAVRLADVPPKQASFVGIVGRGYAVHTRRYLICDARGVDLPIRCLGVLELDFAEKRTLETIRLGR